MRSLLPMRARRSAPLVTFHLDARREPARLELGGRVFARVEER